LKNGFAGDAAVRGGSSSGRGPNLYKPGQLLRPPRRLSAALAVVRRFDLRAEQLRSRPHQPLSAVDAERRGAGTAQRSQHGVVFSAQGH